MSLRFVRTTPEEAVVAVADALATELLAGKKVLWLISGGSNTEWQIASLDNVRRRQISVERLTILPIDERFGPWGHADSNMQRFRAGARLDEEQLVDILDRGLSLHQTADYYGKTAQDLFGWSDVVIGQFGIGSNGHTAGIQPHSPAVTDAEVWAVGFEWTDYQRLTLTPFALSQIDQAVALVFWPDKVTALRDLQAGSKPLDDVPARVLESIPCTIYNDLIGETM